MGRRPIVAGSVNPARIAAIGKTSIDRGQRLQLKLSGLPARSPARGKKVAAVHEAQPPEVGRSGMYESPFAHEA